jgi:hypothetical protein
MRKNDNGKSPSLLTGKKMLTFLNFSPNKSPKITFKRKNKKSNSISGTPKETIKKNHHPKTVLGLTTSWKTHVEPVTWKWAITAARLPTS